LCRARLATMEELLDYDGRWSTDVLNMMIPMAEKAELDEQERMMGAVGALFSKDGFKAHRSRADKLRDSIHARQLAARGIVPTKAEQVDRDLDALERGLFGALKKPKKGGRR
jgi:hypothetical protein